MTDGAGGAVQFASTVTASGTTCPACSRASGRVFYEIEAVPVHQVQLVHSREEALGCDKGNIRLAFCTQCGFIWNSAFEPVLVQYNEEYESTQTVSPTFNRFHDRLARDLTARYDLTGRDIVEIGCGQGEFLTLLCEHGARNAIGFDPVFKGGRSNQGVTIVKDLYSVAYSHLRPDMVVSKMVMEHIPDPGRFLSMLRRTVGDRPNVIAFAMMPEVTRILDLGAFWDVFYEHCSYFSLGSLARAFRMAGFDVVDLWTDYDDQYALIGARPRVGDNAPLSALSVEETSQELGRKVEDFSTHAAHERARWSDWLSQKFKEGRRVVLWGGGSKAVSFLTTLNIRNEIEFAVDINRSRSGTFIAGTGQQIMPPEFLGGFGPDIVIVMSPIYLEEIRANLKAIGQSPEMVSVEAMPFQIA